MRTQLVDSPKRRGNVCVGRRISHCLEGLQLLGKGSDLRRGSVHYCPLSLSMQSVSLNREPTDGQCKLGINTRLRSPDPFPGRVQRGRDREQLALNDLRLSVRLSLSPELRDRRRPRQRLPDRLQIERDGNPRRLRRGPVRSKQLAFERQDSSPAVTSETARRAGTATRRGLHQSSEPARATDSLAIRSSAFIRAAGRRAPNRRAPAGAAEPGGPLRACVPKGVSRCRNSAFRSGRSRGRTGSFRGTRPGLSHRHSFPRGRRRTMRGRCLE